MDRRRDVVDRAGPALGEHRDELLDVERVSLRDLGHASARSRVELGVDRQRVEQLLRLGFAERVQLERARLYGRRPARVLFAELGAREADQEHGRVRRPACEVLQQVEERRLCPVDVLHADDERPPARDRLQRPAHGPERLLCGARRAAGRDRRADPLQDERRVVLALERARKRCKPAGFADDLAEREERDAVAVRQAAAA